MRTETFRQAAGTGYLSIDRPSLQFAMSVVMSGMREPKVVAGSARGINNQADPKTLYVSDTDWAAEELTRKSGSCTVESTTVTCLTDRSRNRSECQWR